ncbi:hypothetical protein N8996_04930 [Candidatus Poseidonia alphae]|nr:hypothetical protein [Candidatus Poseidonia alphae]
MRRNSKDKKERTVSFDKLVSTEDVNIDISSKNKRRQKDDSYEKRIRKKTPDPNTIKQTLEIFLNGYIK